jgi:hypothetical protein
MKRTLSTASGRTIREVALVRREARRLGGIAQRREGATGGPGVRTPH